MPLRPRSGRGPGPRSLQVHSMSADTAWAASDRLLQQLAASNSTPRDWAEAAAGVQMLQQLMDQMPSHTWPQWLLPKLCGAVARGLQPAVMGMSGQQPKSAVLYQQMTRSNEGQVKTQLHALCGVGEMMCRLCDMMQAVSSQEVPQFNLPGAEFVRLVTTKSGLAAAIGTGAGHLASFVKTYKALRENAGGSDDKDAVAYCMMGLTAGTLNLWVLLQEALPDDNPMLVNAVPAISQTVQPVITLAVTLLQAYPGPPVPAAASPAVAAAADVSRARGREVPEQELTAGWVYKTQGLPQAVHVATAVCDAVAEEVWSRAVGNPGSALTPDTPRSVLQLLQNEDTKYLLAFAVMIGAALVYKISKGRRCLDPKAFSTTARGSRRARRRAREQRQQQQQQQQQQRDQQQQQQAVDDLKVEPWHKDLEAVMGISGCWDTLDSNEAFRPEITGLDVLVAVHCCVGATLAARGEAHVGPTAERTMSVVSRRELLPKGVGTPFMKVLVELLLLESDMHIVLLALQLLQGIMPSLKPDGLANMIKPLVGALGPHMVQAVRTADGTKGWKELEGTGMPPEHVRGGMLEAASNFVVALLEPSVSTPAALPALTELLTKQPTVMLSTLDALLRSRAEAEAVNMIYSRRLQVYQVPEGIKLPELLRLVQEVIISSATLNKKGEVSPAAAAARAVLSHPSTAGAAWVGLMVTAQKYALRALMQAPALCAWEVAAAAVVSLLAVNVMVAAAGDMPMVATSAAQLCHRLPVVWTAARDAATNYHQKVNDSLLYVKTVADDDSDEDANEWVDDSNFEPEGLAGTDYNIMWMMLGREESAAGKAEAAALGEKIARQLGPMLVPTVQLYCRWLLLLTKVLLLPPELLNPGMAAMQPVVKQYLGNSWLQLQGDAAVTATYLAVQFLELLLPQLAVAPDATAAAAAAGSGSSAAATAAEGNSRSNAAAAAAGSSSSAGRTAAAAAVGVIPANVAGHLQQKVHDCKDFTRALYSCIIWNAKEPKKKTLPASALLASAQKAFVLELRSSSGNVDNKKLALQELQELASSILAQLPAHRMCANPACVELSSLSEKELCEKRCSACKTSYCSKECSRAHWKTHKPLCQRLTAAAAAAATAPGAAAPI